MQSPTFTTWMATCARLLSIVAVLPFILWKFDAATIAVWLVFATIGGLRVLADMGFTATFVRLTSYARSGVPISGLEPGNLAGSQADRGNADHVVAAVNSAMALVYQRLAAIFAAGLLLFGSLAVARPVSELEVPGEGWCAWLFVIVGTTVAVYNARYQAFLQGMDRIALLRRWEAIVHFVGLIATILVILAGRGLLELVAVAQLVLVIGALNNLRLCRRFPQFRGIAAPGQTRQIVASAWPAVWRSGLGIGLGYGVVQGTALGYAQIGNAEDVAALLLALRLAHVINLFSQPPFYTRIPHMAKLWASGERQRFIETAQVGMRYSLLVVVVGYVATGYLFPSVLDRLGSEANFVSAEFWFLLSTGYFLERYGSMHLQLHSINNVILWHVAHGVSGAIFLIGNILLYPMIGVLAFPAALLLANLGFYSWFCARQSFSLTRTPFLRFEAKGALVPAVLVVVLFAAGLIS